MKKAKQKKSYVVIFIVLLLLGLGIFGALFLKKPVQIRPQNMPVVADDTAELTRLSSEIADGWHIPDLKYEIQVKNRVGDYARAVVYPTNQTLDPLQIIYVKKDGTWTYENMGTSFPDLESQMPDLFRE